MAWLSFWVLASDLDGIRLPRWDESSGDQKASFHGLFFHEALWVNDRLL